MTRFETMQSETMRFEMIPPSMKYLALVALCLALALGACSSHRFAEPEIGNTQRGLASWYGEKFHGRPTASGEIYDMHGMTAAHKDLPLGTVIEVRNLDNGRKLRLRVNDRGPFVRGRIVDLSYAAAKELGVVGPGTAPVEIEVLEIGEGPGRYPPFEDFRYTVQVGAFREMANSKRALEKLLDAGIEARIFSEGGLHRVRSGEFKDRGEARALAKRIRRLGLDAAVVPAN